MTKPKLSIITINYNSWTPLKKLFSTLALQTGINMEVIVIDNASSTAVPAGQFTPLIDANIQHSYIAHNNNDGFAAACNRGAKMAQGELLLFCNPDIEITADSLALLIDSYAKNNIEILSCAQKNSHNVIKSACGKFPTMARFIPLIGGLFKQKYDAIKSEVISHVDWVSGAVVLMSRVVFDQLKGWDEDYFMFMEDVDLCRRAHNLGMTVAVDNSIVWLHHHGLSSKSHIDDRVRSKTAAIISKHTYVGKHFSALKKPFIHGFVFLKYMPELLLGSVLSLLFPAKELLCRRRIMQQYFKYLFT